MTTEKLVRDLIPEIIRAKGEECTTRIAQKKGGEYLGFLIKKLEEEKQEYLTADPSDVLGELGDMYEVIMALGEMHGYHRVDVIIAAEKKREERGGFTKRIIMQITDMK